VTGGVGLPTFATATTRSARWRFEAIASARLAGRAVPRFVIRCGGRWRAGRENGADEPLPFVREISAEEAEPLLTE
jgi:hypothetical protein